ncbi:hypothetical protein BST22_28145 [Mycolicibacterium chubuense]|uniref:Uncharacterized protein n=1 Tax=Mycolicibacterium chubuense TaxID=1800 RepID=A0A0J6WPY2_MYCCU|nr:hypothetical protein [Mycolicibacterium chubuense]KMO84168.1 hypothetical protein MCHUDSM44219_00974 [Mycolicibacterium chubuense]ORA42677.1 hypothetical protein BST22_28145 [Mycolicibacterium chubuense]SPX99808.1 Uncharacterised protein [Mycolicibacterium chubuense]
MSASTTRRGLKYAATILGAFAVLAVAPATAFATDNEPTPGGGCTYTDADGYPIPIDDGQDVFVDGKIVSCRGGTIVVTTAPSRGSVFQPTGPKNGGVFQPTESGGGSVFRPPVINRAPVLAQP